MTALQRVGDWFARLFSRTPWYAHVVEDVPDKLRPRTVYLLGEDVASSWAAALRCPCGCKELIQLSLIADDDPSWRVRVDPHARVTLHPSIWRVRGCHAHFHVRGGKIVWAKNGQPRDGEPATGRAPQRRRRN